MQRCAAKLCSGLEHGKCEALAAEAMRMKDQALSLCSSLQFSGPNRPNRPNAQSRRRIRSLWRLCRPWRRRGPRPAARGPRPETAAPQSPQSPQSLGFAWLRPAGRPRRPWTASTRRKGSLLGEGYGRPGRPGRPAWREVRCFASLLRSQTSIQELKALGKPPRECVDVVAACGFLLRQAWDRRKASSTFGLTAWKRAKAKRERERSTGEEKREREREIHVLNPPPAQIHPNSGSGRWATFDAKTSPGSQICKAGTAKTSPGSNFPKIPKPFSPHRCQDFVKFEPGHVLTASDAKASPGSNFPQIPKISATMARHSP